jgi:hypothetical protein
MFPML